MTFDIRNALNTIDNCPICKDSTEYCDSCKGKIDNIIDNDPELEQDKDLSLRKRAICND